MWKYQSHILVLLFCTWLGGAQAARYIDVKKRLESGLEQWHAKRSVGDPDPNLEHLLGLQKGEELEASDSLPTRSGTTKSKLKETYHGIEIEGETVVVERDQDGYFTGEITGHLVEDLEEDLPTPTPRLSANDAFNIAINHQKILNNQFVSFEKERDAKLVIQLESRGLGEEVNPILVWELNYKIQNSNSVTVSRPFYVIDAQSGSILDSWDGLDSLSVRGVLENLAPVTRNKLMRKDLQMSGSERKVVNVAKREEPLASVAGVGGNVKTGKYIYGKDRPALEVSKSGNTCFLHNDDIIVEDNRVRSGFFGSDIKTGHKFNCEEGNLDAVNGGYSPLNDVYYHCNVAVRMYKEWQNGTYPLVDMKLRAKVHMEAENAHWNGELVEIGDGAHRFYPLTSLDFVTHEVAHGFTEHHSGLIYYGESGGMNEAYSDMAGEAAEDFLNDNDWHVGKDITKFRNGIRFLKDPPKDKISIATYNDYCPDMDVHHSSGIFNYAFYLISQKPGWNVRKAFEIFTRANMLYWTPVSTFSQGACGVLEATKDLHYDVNQVEVSFKAVGIKPCVENPPGLVSMYNLHGKAGEEISFLWHVSENTKDAHIFVSKRNEKEDPDIDLFVQSDDYSLESATKNSGGEQIYIASPSLGPHNIVLQGHDDFNKYVLMVMSNNYTVASDLSHDAIQLKEALQIPIEISETQIQQLGDDHLGIRLHVRDIKKPFPSDMILRYGERVNFEAQAYDYKVNSKSVFIDGDQLFAHVIPCKLQAGTWYIALPGLFEGVDISVYTVHTPERV